jgi:hypothetical protein
MATLATDTVGPLLRGRETRAAALDALEAHAVPIERSVSLGAAPVLGELLALDVAEVGPADFGSCAASLWYKLSCAILVPVL